MYNSLDFVLCNRQRLHEKNKKISFNNILLDVDTYRL